MEKGYGTCRCGEQWTGFAMCHCSVCHRTFTAISGFDKHRSGSVGDRYCLDPATVGLELKPQVRGKDRIGEAWGATDIARAPLGVTHRRSRTASG